LSYAVGALEVTVLLVHHPRLQGSAGDRDSDSDSDSDTGAAGESAGLAEGVVFGLPSASSLDGQTTTPTRTVRRLFADPTADGGNHGGA
jgi:hypothetical protein